MDGEAETDALAPTRAEKRAHWASVHVTGDRGVLIQPARLSREVPRFPPRPSLLSRLLGAR